MTRSVGGEKNEVPISLESDINQRDGDATTSTKEGNGISSVIESTEPTEEQLRTLQHVSDKLPLAAWLVVAFSSAERFSYFGFTGPLR
jgi:POT family proton-dependent oligopeptide transporter